MHNFCWPAESYSQILVAPISSSSPPSTYVCTAESGAAYAASKIKHGVLGHKTKIKWKRVFLFAFFKKLSSNPPHQSGARRPLELQCITDHIPTTSIILALLGCCQHTQCTAQHAFSAHFKLLTLSVLNRAFRERAL